uniref:E3 ubiquitin-protein ligase MARCH3 n=1 Tax=Lygus hesperus TaxID=30085 RepID=A0A0A9X9H8_LYGHE
MDDSKNATAKLDSTTNEPKSASAGPKRSEQNIKQPAGFKDVSSLPKTLLLQKNSKDGHNCTSASAGVVGVTEDAGTTSDVRPRSGGRPLEIRFTDVESCCGQIHSGKSSSAAPPNNQQDALERTASTSLSRTHESSLSNQQFLVDENASFGSSGIFESRPTTTGENICRICHEGDQVEPLISPCMCRGTLSLVHRTCLQHWLAESDSSNCELCRFRYMTKRVPKYSLLGSFIAWLKLNTRQRKALIVDSISIIAFIPFATLITYIAADLADGIEYQDSPTFFDVTIRFGIVSLISMMTTIDVAFATWGILRAQHHFANWYSWYRRNSDVTLIPHLNNPTN